MNKKLLSIALACIVMLSITGCGDDGLSTSEVNKLINGKNSVKGTITGKKLDDTAFSFDYEYKVTTNDGNSYGPESWVEDNGDQVGWIGQYFFFDEHGYADYGDQWSPSGKYLYLDFYFNRETMEQMPLDYSSRYMEGMWQNIEASGTRFVYATYFSTNNSGSTMNITNLKYNSKSRILSGTFNTSMTVDHGNDNWFNNQKATTITGDFNILLPVGFFDVTGTSDNYGNTYRRGK